MPFHGIGKAVEIMLEENEKIFTFNPGYDSVIIFIPYNLVDKERIDYRENQPSYLTNTSKDEEDDSDYEIYPIG